MISAVRLRDYKAYRDETHVPFRRLSVLLGKNNSGKTAVARLPLLLLGALSQRGGAGRAPIPTSVRGLQYGSSMLELVHGEGAFSSFGLGCALDAGPTGEPVEIAADVQLRRTLADGLGSFVKRFSAAPLLPAVEWDGDLASEGDIHYRGAEVRGFDGIMPRFDDTHERQAAEALRLRAGHDLDELVHLTSLRKPLATLYEAQGEPHGSDPSGGDTPHLLNGSEALFDAVAGWYDNALDARIRLVRDPSSFRLVAVGPSGSEHPLARTGQGIQQALPVVTHLQAMALGSGPRLLVVEEPELNLHPAAHGELADLAVAAAQEPDRQVVLETHSENLVLRLRFHVAAGHLRPEDVNLLWFDHRHGSTQVREITITEDGAVTEWPSGVFSEDLQEARAIVSAGRP